MIHKANMTHPPRIYALIVAAGTGTRAGGEVPKQYQPLGGKMLLEHSAGVLAHHPSIAGVQVVIHPKHQAWYNEVRHKLTLLPAAFGGAERADSVAAGLAALAPYAPDYVLIHDAARPFLAPEMIDAIIAKLSPQHAVLPAIPVVDTVRYYDKGEWRDTPREGLLRIQTPQAFPFDALHALYNSSPLAGEDRWGGGPLGSGADAASHPLTPTLSREGRGGITDDAALWLAAGKKLEYVMGAEELRKMTTAEDLAWAEKKNASTRRVAVGTGYDVHALIPAGDDGVIRLGGIDIPSAHKLHGHSDADVVLHAIVDALLGALGEGDIGSHFPPSDERWKGADSKIFIEEARSRVHHRSGVIEHLDITLVGERPKISPYRDAMRESIAQLLHLPLSHVSMKATTTEKLGFTGREEGIACHATATVTLPRE